MGLFSKLLGGDAAGALDALKDAAQKVAGEAADKLKEAQTALQNDLQNKPQAQPAAQPAAPAQAAPARKEEADEEDGPSGFSWGDRKPAEENQYNFNGSYIQYFETVFREDFPEYAVTKSAGTNDWSPVFTFVSGGRKVLIVELKSESSEAQRIRRAAQAEGVPYIRFYYDHPGWWNTRNYVRARVSKALMGR